MFTFGYPDGDLIATWRISTINYQTWLIAMTIYISSSNGMCICFSKVDSRESSTSRNIRETNTKQILFTFLLSSELKFSLSDGWWEKNVVVFLLFGVCLLHIFVELAVFAYNSSSSYFIHFLALVSLSFESCMR